MTRSLDLDTLHLARGAHNPDDDDMCIMEAVAYIAGEPWTDTPRCASPVVAAFVRTWNDDLPDDDRQALKPYIPRLVGSVATPQVEGARAWMALDWLIRGYTPVWLRLAGLTGHADTLAGLPEFKSGADVDAARPVIDAARKDAAAARYAGAAAGYVAGYVAGDAAGAAAGAAAGNAAGDAAGYVAGYVAGAAAGAAAGNAAGDAAEAAALATEGGAAGDAAEAALAPAVAECQASAHRLIDHMLTLNKVNG